MSRIFEFLSGFSENFFSDITPGELAKLISKL